MIPPHTKAIPLNRLPVVRKHGEALFLPFCGFGPGRNPAIRGGGFFFVTQPGSAGEPPLVRLRTDTFLRREKCPRYRVRGWAPLRRTQKERQAPVHCPSPTGCGEARSSARSAHRNGHFPSSWKMSETLRARVGAPRRTRKERQIPAHCPRPRHAPPLAFFDEKCTIPYREIFFPRAGEMKDGRTSEKGRRAADGGGAAPNAAGPGQTGGLL